MASIYLLVFNVQFNCVVKMHHATPVPVESTCLHRPPHLHLPFYLVALRPSTCTWLLGDVVHVAESKCHLPSYFSLSSKTHSILYLNIVSIWMRSFNKNNPYTYTSRQMAQKNRPNKGNKWSQSPFKNASNTPRCNTNCQVHRKFDFWDQQSIPYFPPRWVCKWTNMICIGVPWLYAMKLIFWTCGKGKLERIHVESYGPGCFSLFRTRIKVQLPFEMGSKPTKLHHFLSKIWAILENRSTSPKSWVKWVLYQNLQMNSEGLM